MTENSKADDGGFFHANYDGITRRDWLAGMAMKGILSNPECCDAEIMKDLADGVRGGKDMVNASYLIADAMIARSKEQ